MPNQTERPKISRRTLMWVVFYAVLFYAVLLVTNLTAINQWIAGLLAVLNPLLVGLVLAYLANPFFRFFERRVLIRIRAPRARRALALTLTYLVLLTIVAGLLLLIIPQLIASIQNFVKNFDSYLSTVITQINGLIDLLNGSLSPHEDGSPAIEHLDFAEIQAKVAAFWKELVKALEENLRPENLGYLKNIFTQTTGILTNLMFAIFISLYLLASKEKRYAQIMKFRRAYLSDSVNAKLTHLCTVADRSFGGFLRGKLLDSTIVGILVYLCCLVFDIPYAVLVATVVGVTDIIPIIGPFLGVVPTAVIILLTDPVKVIIFLLCILVIQQIDGNILAPKILGENTGVSSLCVLVSIIVMGDLWGLVGMLVGVPLFATVIELVKLYLEQRLEQKGLPGNTEDYTAPSERREKPRRRQKQPLPGGAGDLSPMEQLQLRTYALARKYRIFTDQSDRALNEFAAEAAAVFAAAAAEQETAAGQEAAAPTPPEDAGTAAETGGGTDEEPSGGTSGGTDSKTDSKTGDGTNGEAGDKSDSGTGGAGAEPGDAAPAGTKGGAHT